MTRRCSRACWSRLPTRSRSWTLTSNTPVFDELVRLKAQQLAISSLVETRYQHHASALNLQADLRLQVENLRASKKLIEEQLADVNARIQKLEA